jgi:hypothetical protein
LQWTTKERSESIQNREKEISQDVAKPISPKVTQEDILRESQILDPFQCPGFQTVHEERDGKNDILNLLRETSGVEFCLFYTVRLFRGEKKNLKETEPLNLGTIVREVNFLVKDNKMGKA